MKLDILLWVAHKFDLDDCLIHLSLEWVLWMIINDFFYWFCSIIILESGNFGCKIWKLNITTPNQIHLGQKRFLSQKIKIKSRSDLCDPIESQLHINNRRYKDISLSSINNLAISLYKDVHLLFHDRPGPRGPNLVSRRCVSWPRHLDHLLQGVETRMPQLRSRLSISRFSKRL